MIAPNELRIGNWVKIGYVPHMVIDGKHIDLYCEDYQPIPLTPEILEKCGFTQRKDTKFGFTVNVFNVGLFALKQSIRKRPMVLLSK